MNKDNIDLINIFRDILGKEKNHNHSKHQISFDCPTCSYEIKNLDKGDGKGNLEINYLIGVYKCWVCNQTHDTHGTLFKLIKKYGNKTHLKKFNLFKPDSFEVNQFIPKNTNIKLPEEFIKLSELNEIDKNKYWVKRILDYLKSRNIDEKIINLNNIGYCESGKYKYRVVIPSYDENGYLNFFVTRSIFKNDRLKYLNPDFPKENLIWNEYKLDWSKDVYLVEGVFDYFFIENSIPLLGKFINDNLFNKIYNNLKGNLYIVLDPDAHNDAEKLYHKLNCGKLMGKIFVIFLNGNKDVADLKGKISEFRKVDIDNEFKLNL